jgi:Uma2 family endonuclease
MNVAWVPERTRISVDRYQKMIATGVLTKYDRVELIDGDILDMAPIGSPHSAVTARLNKLLVLAAGDAAMLSPAGSIVLGDYSQPQPDLMLLKAREDFYAARNPVAEDVLLLIEVSDSSFGYDMGKKRDLYARFGVDEYWVVDIRGKRVHVNRGATQAGYSEAVACAADDVVSPRAFPAFQVRVATLLP